MSKINNVTSFKIIKTFELNQTLIYNINSYNLYITEKKNLVGGGEHYDVFYKDKFIASIDPIEHGRLFSENFIAQCK